MKFTEEQAAEIAARHNVPAATIRTWRRRGAIPDRYTERENLDRADEKTAKYLRRVLNDDRINAAAIGVDAAQIRDAMREHASFYQDDAERITANAKALRDELQRWVKSESGLRKILDDDRLRNFLRDEDVQRFTWRQYKHSTEVELRDEEAAAIRQITKAIIELLKP